MLPGEKTEKKPIKVYVRMHDGSRMLGDVFLAADERLQDIMNDDRMFIPIHVDEKKGVALAMLSKRYIQQIEEVANNMVEDAEPVRDDRRPPNRDRTENRDQADLNKSRSSSFKLELEESPFGRPKDDTDWVD